MCVDENELLKTSSQTFNRIIPWGWSPAAHFRMKELKKNTSEKFQHSRMYNWNLRHRELFERKTASRVLRKFLNKFGDESYCSQDAIPIEIREEREITAYLERFPNVVLKSPISSSGRGIQMIRNKLLSESKRQWANAVINQSGYLTAEPLHHKKLDFSFQFEMNASGKIIRHGTVFFYTSPNGMYQGHHLNLNIASLIGKNLTGLLDKTSEKLKTILENSLYSDLYEGFLGIDGMVIEEKDELKIHPCVEINSRLTMGMLALKIEQMIHPEARGQFEVFRGKEGCFISFSKKMRHEYPVIMKDEKFYSGFINLTDPTGKTKFGAYVILD